MKRIIYGLVGLIILGALVTLVIGAVWGWGGRSLGVRNAWARPALAGNNSAVYFIIENRTGEDDSLLSAACDKAMMTEVHQTFMDADGNMRMEEQPSVPVGARTAVDFMPGSLHIMLMNLKEDLNPGDTLTVQLTFEKAGMVEVEAQVRQP